MDQRDKPSRSWRRIIIVGRAIRLERLSSSDISLLGNADMPQAVEVLNGLVQPCLGIGSLVQTDNQRFQEFPGQSYDALILGLDTRPCFQHQAHDVDGKAKHKNQRQNDVEPARKDNFCHMTFRPQSSRAEFLVQRTLTDKKSNDLIKAYSNYRRDA